MGQAIFNIWCVGRNYADHARELGNAVSETPVVFLKSSACLVPDGSVIQLPQWSKEVHHEVELAFQVDTDINVDKIGIALDLTARDIQSQLKKNAHPWTLAKSFPQSCPISQLKPYDSNNDSALEFSLKVNGEIRQMGRSQDMVHDVPTLLSYLKDHFPIQPGDLILTGTPSGVSKLESGDSLVAEITGKISASWTIA